MSERVIAAAVAAALFAVMGLLISERGQSRVDGVFPKGTPHYMYKRVALTAMIMAISGVQAVLRLPIVFGLSNPLLYKVVPAEPWQIILFILLICVFFTPAAVRFTAPAVVTGGSVRSVVIEEEDPSDDDGWDDAPVRTADEVLRRAQRTNEIHIGRGASSAVVEDDED